MSRAEEYFTEALAKKELGHAYFIETADEAGQEALGRRIARLIDCENGTGCGRCASCRAADSGNHPDISVVKKLPVRGKVRENYSIDDLRPQLIDDVQIRPYRFPHKVYIVPQAEQLNLPTQNALLKTLEEPPAYAVILLLGRNRNALLPTVLSRLVCLTENDGEDGPIPAEPAERMLEKLRRVRYMDPAELSALPSEAKKEGLDEKQFLRLLESFFRDVYLAKGKAFRDALYPGQEAFAGELAASLGDEALGALWDELREAGGKLKLNVNPLMVFELFFLHLQEALNTEQ